MLLWRGRIVVPEALRDTFLQKLHEGHPGASAMKELAKFYAWWPRGDQDIEHFVVACSSCQSVRPREPEAPLLSWNVPSEPWARVHIDFAGPFEGFMWLIAIDAYTKWLDVIKMKTTSASATIGKLRELFARYGLPRIIVSDNGPQFVAEEFQVFCKANSVRHVTGVPYHPKTNGLAERAVRTFKERMLASKVTTPDVNLRLQKFLISYRNTPQKSTGRPPAELLMGRRLRTCLDLLKPDVRANLDAANYRQQKDHDRHHHSKFRAFTTGDPVWVQNTTESGHQQGKVARRTGPLSYEVILLSSGKTARKHADQLRFRRLPDKTDNDDDSDARPLPVTSSRQTEVLPLPLIQQSQQIQPTSQTTKPCQSSTAAAVPDQSPTPVQSSPSPAPAPQEKCANQSNQSVANEHSSVSVTERSQPQRRVQPSRARKFPALPYDKFL